MTFDWKTKTMTTVAAAALMAGTAFADTTDQATTGSTRAAEDDGAVQNQTMEGETSTVTGGTVQSPADPAIADNAPSAADVADEGTQQVVTDTEAGTATGPKADPETVNEAMGAMTVDDVVGLNVLSVNGEDVGEIDYVIQHEGEIAGVVGVGGFLGMGEHSVAIPLSQFGLTPNGQLQLEERTEADLRNMPEVNEDRIQPLDGSIRIGDVS